MVVAGGGVVYNVCMALLILRQEVGGVFIFSFLLWTWILEFFVYKIILFSFLLKCIL